MASPFLWRLTDRSSLCGAARLLTTQRLALALLCRRDMKFMTACAHSAEAHLWSQINKPSNQGTLTEAKRSLVGGVPVAQKLHLFLVDRIEESKPSGVSDELEVPGIVSS